MNQLQESTARQTKQRSYLLNPVWFYHNSRIDRFRPKVRFSFEAGPFTVKTAQSPEEIQMALRLRHQVFLEEGLGKSTSTGYDFDKFDLKAITTP